MLNLDKISQRTAVEKRWSCLTDKHLPIQTNEQHSLFLQSVPSIIYSSVVRRDAKLPIVAAATGPKRANAAAAEAPAVPAAGPGRWPGGAVTSADGAAHGRSHRQQPQPTGAEGLLLQQGAAVQPVRNTSSLSCRLQI